MFCTYLQKNEEIGFGLLRKLRKVRTMSKRIYEIAHPWE